jgi:hypothetical protein
VRPWAGDGTHDLHLTVGGSAGHGGQYRVFVDEGVLSTAGSRHWSVKVTSATDARRDAADERKKLQNAARQEKRRATEGGVLKAIEDEVRSGAAGATQSAIVTRTGWDARKVAPAISPLLAAWRIESVQFRKTVGNAARRQVVGFRPVSGAQ